MDLSYVVAPGDTLQSIANSHHLTEFEVVATNPRLAAVFLVDPEPDREELLSDGEELTLPVHIYQKRDGETAEDLAERFGRTDQRSDEILEANPELESLLESKPDVPLRGVSELEIMADELVHAEFISRPADVEGIDEDDVIRECLARRTDTEIALAYKRLDEARLKRRPPLNRWDRLLEPIAVFGALLLFAIVVLGGTLVVQWVLRRIVDSYSGWSWVSPAFGYALVAAGVLFVVGYLILRASMRVDENYLLDSTWNARLRDFEEAVRNFAIEPVIAGDLARVHFVLPGDDRVEVDRRALTTVTTIDQIVRTDTYRRIAEQLSRPDGATIGLRGTRGAGKTDLVRSFTEGGRQPERRDDGTAGRIQQRTVVGGYISAPASPDDDFAFLRRVALMMCDRVAPPWDGATSTRSKVAEWRWPIFGVLVAVIGAALVYQPASGVEGHHVGWILLIVGLGWALITAIRLLRRRRHRGWERDRNKEKAAKEELLRLAEGDARDLRRRLQYATTTEQSAAGGLDWRAVTAKVSQNVKSAERDLTKDDIVADLENLVLRLDAAGYRVVIGIDELDKVDVDGDVAKLLNSMKSLFSIRSCSFLITISTSAWSTFEQRGLKIRTVFDSSFDEIIEAAPLSFLDARSLCRGRGGMLSDSQVLFVDVASGGIARDLLRHARLLARVGSRGSLTEAVARFVDDEADSKMEAAILDIRGESESPASEAFITELHELERRWKRTDRSNKLQVLSELDELLSRLSHACEVADAAAEDERSVTSDPTDGDGSAAPTDEQLRLNRIEARVVGYLAFLRLLELAFADDGPIVELTTSVPTLFAELPATAIAPFETLRATREQIGYGCISAQRSLREARAMVVGDLAPAMNAPPERAAELLDAASSA